MLRDKPERKDSALEVIARLRRSTATVPGINGVINKIRLKASGNVRATPDEIRRQIRDSLAKRAEREWNRIAVVVDNSRVILEGTVGSRGEASEAENAAWETPGVVEVENRLKIAA